MQIMGPGVRAESATPTNPCGVNTTPWFAFLSLQAAQSTSSYSKMPPSKGTTNGMPCLTRRLRIPAHTTSFFAQPDPSTSVVPMAQSRVSVSIRTIVERAVPCLHVEDIVIIPTKRPLRTFNIKLADERALLLNLPPALPSSLLRSEQWLLQSEAAIIEWLEEACQYQSKGTRRLNEEIGGRGYRTEDSPTRRIDKPTSDVISPCEGSQLVDYLPTLIRHSSTLTKTDSIFTLFEPTSGIPISSLKTPLTDAERKSINFQKGRLMRRIANMTAPNGRFGPAVTVLRPHQPSQGQHRATTPGITSDFDGAVRWRQAFHLLLEGILRDAEDLAVTMSYELVRSNFHKFGHLLDAVTRSRLVLYDGDEDDIVLVSKLGETSPKTSTKKHDKNREMAEGEQPNLRITGLRDWSNCIFGDPLFATVFSSQRTTPEFDLGFNESIIYDTHIDNDGDDDENHENTQEQRRKERHQKNTDDDFIEDADNAPIRILLYECYHATVSIVRQFYRPDADSSERELAARRRLMAALAGLERVSVAASSAGESSSKRPRPPSREAWPASKRPRGDTPTPKQAAK